MVVRGEESLSRVPLTQLQINSTRQRISTKMHRTSMMVGVRVGSCWAGERLETRPHHRSHETEPAAAQVEPASADDDHVIQRQHPPTSQLIGNSLTDDDPTTTRLEVGSWDCF